MNARAWQDMIIATLSDPASVARMLMSLRLNREAMWTGLALAAVMNGLLIGISNALNPPPAIVPPLFQAPVLLVFAVFAALVVLVAAFTICGRWLGGEGDFDDVMVLVLWLQFLRVLVQAATVLFLQIMPLLSLLLSLGAGIMGIYITLHFLNEAHRLQSLGKAAGVLIAALVGMVLTLTFLLSLVGGPILEASSGV